MDSKHASVRKEFEADLQELADAPEAEKKRVYRRLAKKYHPDQHKGSEELYAELFKELENARSGRTSEGGKDEKDEPEADFDDDAWARGGEEAEEVAPGHEEDEV